MALIAFVAVLGAALGMARSVDPGPGRVDALARELDGRGMAVDRESVHWLDVPPFDGLSAATVGVTAIVRARPSEDAPHDIFLVNTRLTPEGALAGVGRSYNLTDTSLVDDGRVVVHGARFAFVEQPLEADAKPSRVRFVDLSSARGDEQGWSRGEQLRQALTRLQHTGRVNGVAAYSYVVQPTPDSLVVTIDDEQLQVVADGQRASIDFAKPETVPEFLSVMRAEESRPPELVQWAVDRVRGEIGSNNMQYVKAVAYSLKDWFAFGTEQVTGATGEEDIAADLGEDSLEDVVRSTPVDPEIGFPPPPLDLWVEPGLPGEGEWRPKDQDPFIQTLPGLPPTFMTTFIRSDKRRKVTRVYIALWDPRLVKLNMMAGLAEPKSATGETGTGTIPREPTVLRRVAAAFNAGFQSLHGEYGMMSDGVIYLPPKPYGATVATMRDGSIAFGTWPDSAMIPSDMASYRQNMTVMVLDEKFNPYGRTWWGGTPADWEDDTHTVRTGICLTKENFVGYFYGQDISPQALARAMIQARCSFGIALDMNAGHSGLEYYKIAPKSELPPLDRPLRRDWEREGEVKGLEDWNFRARRLVRGMGLMYFPRYIRRGEGRDYFYLTLRHVLPGPPLGDTEWQVKGLPQGGFPYAIAATSVTLGDVKARVVKLDPRMIRSGGPGAGTGAVVALVDPLPINDGDLQVWQSPSAFSVAEKAPVAEAVRIAGGPALKSGAVRAAIAVQQDEGMLLYVEAESAVPAAELASLLQKLGAGPAVGLEAPWPVALGGDTSVTGQGIRIPEASRLVRLLRHAGPGAKKIFEDTPIVKFEKWYPLQSRRIRYFKKRKSQSGS